MAKSSTTRSYSDVLREAAVSSNRPSRNELQHTQQNQNTLRNVQQNQNMLLPVNQLPVEMLLRIFFKVREGMPPRERPIARTWIAVAYVCKAWREAALDCASLWTDVPFSFGARWANAFVARSRTATLFLPPFQSHLPKWQHDIFHNHIDRVLNLEFEGSSPSGSFDLGWMYDLTTNRIPERLEKIELRPYSRETMGADDSVILNRAPRLREVVIHNIYFPWSYLPWARLGRVEIVLPSTSFEFATANLPLLIASLASAATLEELHLNTLACPFKPTSAYEAGTANLNRLRSFKFVGFAADFKSISTAVHIPSSSRLDVALYTDPRGAANASMVSALVRAHAGRTQQRPSGCIQTMRLLASTASRECTASIEGWQTASNSASLPDMLDIFISVSLRFPAPFQHSGQDASQVLAALCEDVELGSLRHLYASFHQDVGGADVWDTRIWHALFGPARKVEFLHLMGAWIPQFFDALSTPIKDTANVAQGDAAADSLFPSLAHVRLAFYILDSRRDDLLACMRARALQAPVKVLDVKGSSMDKPTLEGLQDIDGLEVVWNTLVDHAGASEGSS